jgi:RNA 3'-terminal phosphate cyclase
MPSLDRADVRCAVALGLLLQPALHGCQTVEAQHPLGAYYDVEGAWCGDYAIDPGRARVAVLAALAEMHMLVGQEGFYPSGGGFLDTKTPDQFDARLTLLPRGAGTQVRVCIGGFGTHRQVAARILDELARHREAARRGPPAPGLVVVPAVGGWIGPPPVIVVRPGSPAPPALPSVPPPPTPVQ